MTSGKDLIVNFSTEWSDTLLLEDLVSCAKTTGIGCATARQDGARQA
jgi:hypothetical protein